MVSITRLETCSLTPPTIYSFVLRHIAGFPDDAYLEKGHGGSVSDRAVLDFGLLGQVVGGVDGRVHPLHREKGSQVSGVGGNDDQREKPPNSANYPGGQGLGHQLGT